LVVSSLDLDPQDENYEADEVELPERGTVLVGVPSGDVQNVYDLDLNRVGLLVAHKHWVWLDGWDNAWALYFQDSSFESSDLTVEDLLPGAQLARFQAWLQQEKRKQKTQMKEEEEGQSDGSYDLKRLIGLCEQAGLFTCITLEEHAFANSDNNKKIVLLNFDSTIVTHKGNPFFFSLA
jgi:hypothetical protein